MPILGEPASDSHTAANMKLSIQVESFHPEDEKDTSPSNANNVSAAD
jgi:hypothetical protein